MVSHMQISKSLLGWLFVLFGSTVPLARSDSLRTAREQGNVNRDISRLYQFLISHEWVFLSLCALMNGALFMLYFVLPLGAEFNHRQIGSAMWMPDNVLNVGILEWGFRSLWAANRSVFDWPAGYPLHHSLAGTENLLGWQLAYSPLRWVGVSSVLAFNVLVLLSFVVSGLTATALARRLGLPRGGGMHRGCSVYICPRSHVLHGSDPNSGRVLASPSLVAL